MEFMLWGGTFAFIVGAMFRLGQEVAELAVNKIYEKYFGRE